VHLRSSNPPARLEHTCDRPHHYLSLSALPLGSSACGRTIHDNSPFPPCIGKFRKGKRCPSPTWTSFDFSRIPKASRVLLIPINMPLTIKEKHTSFGEDQRLLQEWFSLVFIFLCYFLLRMIFIRIICN
jgi:hypothetical protein